MSVVDISSVRLVANVVEKDLRLVTVGDPARVEVDAFPGETFAGQIARVAPVLDPATRTAEIEIEVPNAGFRLKPGMYARMGVTIENRKGTTLVPKAAVVDYDSKRGVFTMTAENKAKFVPIETGIEDAEHVEVRGGITTADTLVTAGAARAARERHAGHRRPGRPRRPRAGRPARPGAGTGAGAAERAGPASGPRPGPDSDRRVERPRRLRPSRLWRTDEYPATRHRPTGDDVHAELRRHAARRHLAVTAAGRPDAGHRASPRITVRVNYTGVGPLEMEELITRPIEQAVSAVAGLDQINSTSSEGNSTVRLNFTWGTDLNEAADEVRTRIDRVRGRLPEDADPPTIFKFDSTSFPIMGIGVEGNFDAVTLREMAQNDLSPRLERVAGVAAVSVDGGLRRQIRVDLSREKITALNLSVDRVVNVLRTENQNIPLGEVFEGDRGCCCCAAPASSPTSTRSATWR